MSEYPAWEVLHYDDPEEREKWRARCRMFSDLDISYRPEYAYLFQLKGDGRACCFVYSESKEDLVIYPFLVRRINELPRFRDLPDRVIDITVPYGYGGYLRRNSRLDMERFCPVFQAYCRENLVVSEFVRFHPLLANQEYCPRHVHLQKWNDTVVMDLSGTGDDLWRNLTPPCRNKVRKAQKSGLRVVLEEGCENLEVFHRLYTDTMTRLQATPYYFFSLAWFQKLVELFPKNAVLAHVYQGGSIIATTLFLFSGRYMHYFLTGSDSAGRRFGANNLLLYEAALWGKSKGFQYLHLGGGQQSDDNLFQFKASFSPLRAPFYVGTVIHTKEFYRYLDAKKLDGDTKNMSIDQYFPSYRI
jgi:serine/alanine adding enzyme